MPQTGHAWWDEVQHLRPDAQPTASRTAARFDRGTVTSSAHRPADDQPSGLPRAERSARRRGPERGEARRLGRDDAAGFAAAFDLDGAFGASAQTTGSRTIVLERSASEVEDVVARGSGRTVVLERADGAPGGRRIVLERTPEASRAASTPALVRTGPSLLDRLGSNPDRVAMWAVMLGLFLLLLATTSA